MQTQRKKKKGGRKKHVGKEMLIACKETVWKLTEKWQSWISLNGKPPRDAWYASNTLYTVFNATLFLSSHFFFFLFLFSRRKKGVNKSFSLLSISLCSPDFYVSLKNGGTKELTKKEIRSRATTAVCVTIHKIETRVEIDFVYESCANLKTPIRRSNGVTTCASLWIVLINLS